MARSLTGSLEKARLDGTAEGMVIFNYIFTKQI